LPAPLLPQENQHRSTMATVSPAFKSPAARILLTPTPCPRVHGNYGLRSGLDGQALDDHTLRRALAAAKIQSLLQLAESAARLQLQPKPADRDALTGQQGFPLHAGRHGANSDSG
jgi:hypothetical protein